MGPGRPGGGTNLTRSQEPATPFTPSAHDTDKAAIFGHMILANRRQREGVQIAAIYQEAVKPWCLVAALALACCGVRWKRDLVR